jgi:glycosyltransferase involved in cell wall biosynthesis
MTNLRRRKVLYIIATNFSSNTGGLIWTSKLASYAQRKYRFTKVVDLSRQHRFLQKYRFLEILYYVLFFLKRRNYFVFIDHRLHLRFSIPLLISCLIKKTSYATICHHVFFKIKTNIFRRIIEYASEKVFLKHARFTIVPSHNTAADLQNMKVRKKRIVVVNPAPTIDNGNIPLRSSKNRLLMVGNIEPRKGLDSAFKALVLLKKYDFILDIVGGHGQYENYYKEISTFVADKGLSEKVVFHGRVRQENLRQLYRNANIFLFPSRHEGYGIVLKEAMNFALPIIATDLPTTKEIIKDKINGFLFRVNDIYTMADLIKKLIQNKSLQDKVGKTNFMASRYFKSWEDVIAKSFQAIMKYVL